MTANTVERIRHQGLRNKIMSAEQAAELIQDGMTLGIAGFTGAGYPKALPTAIAERAKAAHSAGKPFKINMITGASTAPDCDGVLAAADAVAFRAPFQSDPGIRNSINAGNIHYQDMHLSHVEQQIRNGFYGDIHVAIIEAAGITEEGKIIPAMGIGHNNEVLKAADKVIIEVNAKQNEKLESMHDVYFDVGTPPHRPAIPLLEPDGRIGSPYLECDLNKIAAIVLTDSFDRNSKFADPDENSKRIAAQIIDFFDHEVKAGRLPANLLPLQSGVGNVANAVLAGLLDAPFDNLTGYTEVLQDGMLDLIIAGKMKSASATALSFSPDALQRFNDNIDFLRDKIILRPMEITNNPELIRRLGVIGMNAMIEADIYGNVNSTHVMGTKMMNGIGGSGDFTRNAFFSFFVSPSVAKDGAISCIVPMVSHHDHTEHDVMFIVTEQGMADLRGKSPRQRARLIINNCAHPDYRDMLNDYYDRAEKAAAGLHTPHILSEALSWHQRFVETGDMRIK
ncbi:acetyl-CoA hydrolase/transferase family protein [Neisseria sp. ZJ106]|uniref:Acetyl-CoA hydrolase/transferase family protein n=1 Tax=Neisseria lisongii TaxID=2912188 RepID=A0AAW5AR01_9NEIS|nr:acetyl-CoA hydrolase/transferase family protein [Neisseria lisongii]MCF7521627.1 acetyl-CoA hydrolase/transferase family protein [Neisseria lisongii]MCF7529405.1 acetyl-CoA hydrolase/transferase family protein [Neisseria lisongii]WCL70863.1 acetyl-CoA hydrolase/transferase family protein [Neisseria lisongii]